MLVVCGSATSWIAKNLLESKGGLHNRVTRIIDLEVCLLDRRERVDLILAVFCLGLFHGLTVAVRAGVF